MTIKLYEDDVYLKKSDCKIIDIVEIDGRSFIETDKTVFFPEGGGQPSDIGVIGESEIDDVIEKDGKLLHRAKLLVGLSVGRNTNMSINWDRRLDNMQQHCGEHILSGIFMSEYNAVNKGFHMGDEVVTIDVDIKEMTKAMMDKVEDMANAAIYDNAEIIIHKSLTKEEAEKFNVRKETKVDEDIRMVEVKGIDIVACCGSHPSRTGEVGMIKVLKFEKYKSITRIHFVCGVRALKNFRAKHDLLTKVNQKYSADETTLLERLKTEDDKLKKAKGELNKLSKLVNESKAEKILANSETNMIVEKIENTSAEDLMSIAKRIIEVSDKLVCLASTVDLKVIMMHSGTSVVHCGKFFKDNLPAFDGKGGGGDKMAQAMFKREDDIDCFFAAIKMMLK